MATDDDRMMALRVAGLYVGQLDPDELEAFKRCVDEGSARRDYHGVGGLMGMAKVRYCGLPTEPHTEGGGNG